MPLEITMYPDGINKLEEGKLARTSATKDVTFSNITSCIGVIFVKGDVKIAAHFVLYDIDNYGEMIDTLKAELTGSGWTITVVIEHGTTAKPYVASHITNLNMARPELTRGLCDLLGLRIELPEKRKETEDYRDYYRTSLQMIERQLTALPFSVIIQ